MSKSEKTPLIQIVNPPPLAPSATDLRPFPKNRKPR
jgi:hypothetical protein